MPTYFSALTNDSSQDGTSQEPPVEMFNKDLRMFEESVQAAEKHESLSAFKTLRIPLVGYELFLYCLNMSCLVWVCVIYICGVCLCVM